MKNNRIISICLMIILLICAAFMDYGYNKFEDLFVSEFQFAPLRWYEFFTSILWAALVLGVAWYILAANPGSHSVAITYLLMGALVLFSQTFFVYGYLLGPLAHPTQGIRMRMADIFYSHLSLTVHTAAMITMIGAARLIPDRWLRPSRR